MGQDNIGKSVERLLQSMEDLIGAEQSGAAPGNRGPFDPKSSYTKNSNALEANWSRLQSRNRSIPKQVGKLACAKTWTNAFLESKLALRVGLVLAAVREQAEAATSGAGTTEVSRCVSLHTVTSLWMKEIVSVNDLRHKMSLVAVAQSLRSRAAC